MSCVSFACVQSQHRHESDFSQYSTSAVSSIPALGPLLGSRTDPGEYNDDSRSNTDTASETSASPYDCSDGSATGERRRRCSASSRRPSVRHYGGRRREEPPVVFGSLAEKRAWERERLKKDNHNTSMFSGHNTRISLPCTLLAVFRASTAISFVIISVTIKAHIRGRADHFNNLL